MPVLVLAFVLSTLHYLCVCECAHVTIGTRTPCSDVSVQQAHHVNQAYDQQGGRDHTHPYLGISQPAVVEVHPEDVKQPALTSELKPRDTEYVWYECVWCVCVCVYVYGGCVVCACTVCKYGVLSKPIHTCTGKNGHRVPTKVTPSANQGHTQCHATKVTPSANHARSHPVPTKVTPSANQGHTQCQPRSQAQSWPCCLHPLGAPTHLPLYHVHFLLTHRTLPEVTSQAEGHMMSTCTSSRVVKG